VLGRQVEQDSLVALALRVDAIQRHVRVVTVTDSVHVRTDHVTFLRQRVEQLLQPLQSYECTSSSSSSSSSSFYLLEKYNNRQRGNRRSHFACAVHSRHPRQRRNGPFCCCMTLFAANALQCTVSGEANPQNCPFSLRFRQPAGGGPSHGHRHHAQEIGKDHAYGFGDILSDRHTHTHTQTVRRDRRYRSQCFATAPTGEVIRSTGYIYVV